jgi:hypothetical protein
MHRTRNPRCVCGGRGFALIHPQIEIEEEDSLTSLESTCERHRDASAPHRSLTRRPRRDAEANPADRSGSCARPAATFPSTVRTRAAVPARSSKSLPRCAGACSTEVTLQPMRRLRSRRGDRLCSDILVVPLRPRPARSRLRRRARVRSPRPDHRMLSRRHRAAMPLAAADCAPTRSARPCGMVRAALARREVR